MNNIHKPKVFTAKESLIIKTICLSIASFIAIIALLSGNGLAFALVFSVSIPLFFLGFSIQPEKQKTQIKSDRAIIEKIQQQYTKPNNYLFSKFTLYLIAILITVFGIYELSSGETQSGSIIIVAIALANHAQLRD
jgi:hypothetical protein